MTVPLMAASLSACAIGQPGGFTARSNYFCSDALSGIAALHDPTSPQQQLRYATDRYTILEKAVSELTDSSLPSGRRGEQLRTQWLRPARASLSAGRAVLAQLRDAERSDAVATATADYQRARAIGTGGVDTALLRGDELDRCATLFSAPTLPI